MNLLPNPQPNFLLVLDRVYQYTMLRYIMIAINKTNPCQLIMQRNQLYV
jgi:hypothetical protein